MKTWAILFCTLLVAACSESLPADETPSQDAAPADVLDDAADNDASADAAADTGTPDAAPADVAEEDTPTADAGEDTADSSSEDASDAEEDAASEDAAESDADVADDAVVDAPPEDAASVDAGSPCSEGCEAPYLCITGVCQRNIASTTWAETEFEIVEPEELIAVFGLIKDLAIGVRFLAFDVQPGGVAEHIASYGAVDEVEADDEAELQPVSWQEGFDATGTILFRPNRPDDTPLRGDSWISDPFSYDLSARVTIELPGLPTQVAALGLDVQDARVVLNLPGDGVVATGSAGGVITREEAESREMFNNEDVAPLRALLCSDIPTFEPEGDVWLLADLLDCNGAPLDVDTNGDGSFDAYRALIAAEFERVALVPRP